MIFEVSSFRCHSTHCSERKLRFKISHYIYQPRLVYVLRVSQGPLFKSWGWANKVVHLPFAHVCFSDCLSIGDGLWSLWSGLGFTTLLTSTDLYHTSSGMMNIQGQLCAENFNSHDMTRRLGLRRLCGRKHGEPQWNQLQELGMTQFLNDLDIKIWMA